MPVTELGTGRGRSGGGEIKGRNQGHLWKLMLFQFRSNIKCAHKVHLKMYIRNRERAKLINKLT